MAKFFFGVLNGKRIARLFFKKSFSNFFVTLTDMKGNVLASVSSGKANEGVSKKRKKSHYSMEAVFQQLLEVLQYFRIFFLELILKVRIGAHVFALVRELSFYGFTISKILELNKIPHMVLEVERKQENKLKPVEGKLLESFPFFIEYLSLGRFYEVKSDMLERLECIVVSSFDNLQYLDIGLKGYVIVPFSYFYFRRFLKFDTVFFLRHFKFILYNSYSFFDIFIGKAFDYIPRIFLNQGLNFLDVFNEFYNCFFFESRRNIILNRISLYLFSFFVRMEEFLLFSFFRYMVVTKFVCIPGWYNYFFVWGIFDKLYNMYTRRFFFRIRFYNFFSKLRGILVNFIFCCVEFNSVYYNIFFKNYIGVLFSFLENFFNFFIFYREIFFLSSFYFKWFFLKNFFMDFFFFSKHGFYVFYFLKFFFYYKLYIFFSDLLVFSFSRFIDFFASKSFKRFRIYNYKKKIKLYFFFKDIRHSVNSRVDWKHYIRSFYRKKRSLIRSTFYKRFDSLLVKRFFLPDNNNYSFMFKLFCFKPFTFCSSLLSFLKGFFFRYKKFLYTLIKNFYFFCSSLFLKSFGDVSDYIFFLRKIVFNLFFFCFSIKVDKVGKASRKTIINLEFKNLYYRFRNFFAPWKFIDKKKVIEKKKSFFLEFRKLYFLKFPEKKRLGRKIKIFDEFVRFIQHFSSLEMAKNRNKRFNYIGRNKRFNYIGRNKRFNYIGRNKRFNYIGRNKKFN
jgi:ribosomal protein S11